MTEKQQYIVLAAVVLVMLAALVLAARLSGPERAQSPASVFVARPGAAEDRPWLAVFRRGETKAPDEFSVDEESEDGVREVVVVDKPLSEAEQAVQDAANAMSVDEAVAALTQRLGDFAGTEEESYMHASLAELYMRADAPDLEAAQTALDKAAATAQSAVDRQRVAHAEAQVLLAAGKEEEAVQRIEELLAANKALTVDGLRLAVLRGTLYEKAERYEAAEQAYQEAMERALAAFERLGRDARNVYRQACLKLSRFYRKTGREQQAGQIRQEMQLHLD